MNRGQLIMRIDGLLYEYECCKLLDSMDINKILDEAKQEFPFQPEKYWQTPQQELEHWERYLLQITEDLTDREMPRERQEFHRILASWVKTRIKDLHWFLKWFNE